MDINGSIFLPDDLEPGIDLNFKARVCSQEIKNGRQHLTLEGIDYPGAVVETTLYDYDEFLEIGDIRPIRLTLMGRLKEN